MADLSLGAVRPSVVVLDTSALVADPVIYRSLSSDSGPVSVVLPLVVVRELNGLKARQDQVGAAARAALRALESLRVSAGGSLRDPYPLGDGVALLVDDCQDMPPRLVLSEADSAILACAQRWVAALSHSRVALVAADAALRLTADQFGIEAREVAGRDVEFDTGWSCVEADGSVIDRAFRDGRLAVAGLDDSLVCGSNRFVVARCGSQSVLLRRKGDWMTVVDPQLSAWDVRPRSVEQRLALDLLLDDDVPLVALAGRSGTGKTLLALAAGLDLVMNARRFEHLSVFRPIIPVGRAEIGFLPGDAKDKLQPWMAALDDQFKVFNPARAGKNDRSAEPVSQLALLEQRGMLSCESVTYLRGRSLHRHFVLVDEAQNLSRATVKTVLTRLAEGSKVVLVGDINQIDDPYLSSRDNGLVALLDAFDGQACFGHVSLMRCERSAVADLADRLL